MDLHGGAEDATPTICMEVPFEIECVQGGDSITLGSTEEGREWYDGSDNNNDDDNNSKDDRTLFAGHFHRSDENAFEAFSRRRKARKMKRKSTAGMQKDKTFGRSRLPLIVAIIVASIVLAASIVVIAVSVRTYRQQQRQQQQQQSNDLLRTSSSPTTSLSSTQSPAPTTPHRHAPTVPSTLSPSTTMDHLPLSNPVPTTGDDDTIIFYAFGDAPYNATQADKLGNQISHVPDDAEFIVHLGDMRKAGRTITEDGEDGGNATVCLSDDYEIVRRIFRQSKKPVLIVVGDNDMNDCANPNEAKQFWDREFLDIPEEGWGFVPFAVHRRRDPPGHADQYHFIYKNTLFLALRLIGGNVTDEATREVELLDQWNWAEGVIEKYRVRRLAEMATGRVVMFAHADPHAKHDAFFVPFAAYYAIHQTQLALLYLNGDRHEWAYNDRFMGFPNAKQITVSGEVVDPLLKITVHNVENPLDDPFEHDRTLETES
jgi:hypothetical protein